MMQKSPNGLYVPWRAWPPRPAPRAYDPLEEAWPTWSIPRPAWIKLGDPYVLHGIWTQLKYGGSVVAAAAAGMHFIQKGHE